MNTVGLFVLDLDPPSDEELEPLARVVTLQQAGEDRAGGFVIATPLGLGNRDALERELSGMGVTLARRDTVTDWPRASTAIYARATDRSSLEMAYAFETAWRRLFAGQPAEVWWLASDKDDAVLRDHKYDLRRRLPNQPVRLSVGGNVRLSKLHPFHLPDRDRKGIEAAAIVAWLAEGRRR